MSAQTGTIKQLELENFKSYKGATVVGPFTSFSCIVGPNGSGKSNIMDALSFVLGTAATSLRGKKATDFINRQVLASNKAAKASVTIVVCRGEGTIRLTRSVGAKGDMSVFLDNRAIDEKEFLLVLRKLGISARTNTFLVFQHEVEAIAHKKARELTELIEQVSGSAELKEEYNNRKRAMDQCAEGLTNASLEKRGATAEVNQMRLHKKEADKFKEVSTLLSEHRSDLALTELFHLETQLLKQKEHLAHFEAEVKKIEEGLTSEDRVKKMKKEYADKHKVYLDKLKGNRLAATTYREKRSIVDRIKASVAHFERKIEDLSKELTQAKDSSAVRSKEKSRLEEHLRHQESLLAAFNKQCEEDDHKSGAQGRLTAAQLQEYKNLKRDADIKTITQRQEQESIRRQYESISEGRKQGTLALEGRQAAIRELEAAVHRSVQRIEEGKSKALEAANEVKRLEADLTSLKDQMVKVSSRHTHDDAELKQIESQLLELRHVKEDTRSNVKAQEALDALKNMFGGVRGRLVDLIVPEEGYRIAVTVALGKNLEAIVCDTTETALNCVRYLKEQRLNTMSFIPLEGAQGRGVDDRLRGFGGTCKPIVDVLRYEPSLEPAIRYSVGQTLVCSGMEEARRIAFGGPERQKVVTLEGNVLLKNGSIQGGLAAVQSRAKKWDEKRYDELKAARDAILERVGGGSEAEEARLLVEVRNCEAKLQTFTHRISALNADVSLQTSTCEGLRASLKKEKDQLHALEAKVAHYNTLLEKSEGELSAIDKQISDIEKTVFAVFQKAAGIADISELDRKETLQARLRIEKRRTYLVAIQQLKHSIDAEDKRLGVRQPADIQEAISKAKKELAACAQELTKEMGVAQDWSKRAEAAQAAIATAKGELDAMEAAIRNASRSSEGEVRRVFALRKNINMAVGACNALRQQRASLFQRCRIEEIDLPTTPYQNQPGSKRPRQGDASPDAFLDHVSISEPFQTFSEGTGSNAKETLICVDFAGLSAARRREAVSEEAFRAFKLRTEAAIDQLEREVEVIAPNLKAYSRFSSSEQKLDKTAVFVDEAREKHRAATIEFNRVKEARLQRFHALFEPLVDHVDRIYKELTRSTRAHDVHGTAYLALEDSDEPYNGGTLYNAVPPMKRFMTIDALSGGERTMAAMALLFAFHATSPTPFFVLDEVDAALDVGNVQKLAHYLRSNSKSCQFIVVSLKEELYHTAETLIGVHKDQEKQTSSIKTLSLQGYS